MMATTKKTRVRKWKTQYNAEEFPKGYEKPRGVSLTIPDQSMSLKTLLERFTRGLPLPSASGYGAEQYYGDDEDYMINPATLDISEKHELINNNKQRIYDIQKELHEQEQARQAEAIAKQQSQSQKDSTKVETTTTTVQS